MICFGTGPEGEFRLPAPVRIRLDRDADAPADGFEGVFPMPKSCGPLTGLTIQNGDGSALFDGIVDEQEQGLSGGTLTLSARSRAALLLDNEAMPQNYVNPSLGTVFDRHVRPYGFARYLGEDKVFSGTLSVSKGMSEWAAAASFCTRFLKTEPRVVNGVFDASGAAPGREIVFGKGGVRFTSGLLRNRNCELYSEVYALDPDGGAYFLAAADSGAETLGVRRRRFLSGGADASAVLKKAEQSAFEAVLDCPGNIAAPPLSPARIAGTETGGSLCVRSARYVLEAQGEHTVITLRRK
ncbi:hypothetical protein CAFE_18140 [Caprobacter fermentans]|uniref:Uncharacterized protein n=1 Tax=Caproicibacter fermentans TaxID=2576756 RepID=A0A6N8HZ38_9FIRM|nr:hypothetical protein [Caproicibacter fermentans]MVB11111.1 hypothetical protein [Caproicibacter fermentans]OCN01755.1 hypothetical protein A7X67_01315 [Clostridium sp. W14A]